MSTKHYSAWPAQRSASAVSPLPGPRSGWPSRRWTCSSPGPNGRSLAHQSRLGRTLLSSFWIDL